MKSQTFSSIKGLLLLLGGMAICGCAQNSNALTETATPEKTVEPAETDSVAQPPPPDLDLVALKKPDAPPVKTSPGVDEVIKLAESGAEDSVIETYIENSPIAYRLGADEIVYLRDIGISEAVISSMMKHGGVVREKDGKVLAEDQAAQAKVEAEKTLATETGNPPPAPPQPTGGEQVPAPSTYVDNGQQPPVYSAPLTPPAEVNNFYSGLSPYGSWYDLPGYGWCWQPTVVAVAPSWQPYCNGGQWLYSNCGWYWSSTYSWGWAPFHYGRWWHHANRGWVWFPGSVWSPAWVTWRTGGAYCGWAPVPPRAFCGSSGIGVSASFSFGLGPGHFTFVSYRDFATRNPGFHRLPQGEVNHVFNNTKIVNNIVVGPNKTVVNQGIGFEKVASASRTPIRRVDVPNAPQANSGIVRADHLERRGSALVITSQPVLARPANPPGMTASLSRTPVQHTGLLNTSGITPAPTSTVLPRTETPRRPATSSVQPTIVPSANLNRPVQTTPSIANKPNAPRTVTPQTSSQPQLQSQLPRATWSVPATSPAPSGNDSAVERSAQPGGSRATYSTPQAVANRPPGFSVPTVTAPQTMQPRSQPTVVGQPAQAYNYPRSQTYYVPQPQAQPTVVQPARPQIGVQAPQHAAPTYNPAPRSTVSSSQPVQSRPAAPSSPVGRDK